MSEFDPVDGVLYRTAGEWRAFKQRQRAIGEEVGRIAERAACAALCREAGCVCDELDGVVWGPPESGPCRFCGKEHAGACDIPPPFPGGAPYYYLPVGEDILQHDPRCPAALASRIEARGRE